ncbi:hypothetical protein C8J56DRAFT_1108574, partial [Mycena floridula]
LSRPLPIRKSYTNSATANPKLHLCPRCSQPLPTSLPACRKCWTISTVSPSYDFYDILDISPDPNPFAVDTAALTRQFRKSQVACHPDTWSAQGSDKQDTAHTLSAAVNQAYQTLLHPSSRIEYILQLKGHPLTETEKVTDMDFLIEVYAAREELEEAENPEQVQTLLKEMNGRCFPELETEILQRVRDQEWESAKESAIKLKYIEGIKKDASAWSK